MKRLPNPFAPTTRLRIFAAVTIGSAAAISFESIRHLAETAGFGTFSWLFPATLDAVAAYGMDLWVRRSAAWKQARALALAAIGGSLIANIADHWLSQRSILPAVLGAVPPAMLAALLAVAHRHGSGTAEVDRSIDTAVRDAVWRTLPQAPRWTPDRPDRYTLPDRIMSLDRSAPLYGPPVGPLAAGPLEVVRTEDQVDPTDRVVPLKPVQRKRTSAARVAGTTRRTASLATDAEIVAWIKDQGGASKRAVMTQFGVGSPKALRLKTLAEEA